MGLHNTSIGSKTVAQLYFYYSAMNAGKSTSLLQSAHNYGEQGMQVLLFTAAIDDRFEQGVIRSRIGLQQNAAMFDEQTDFKKHVSEVLEKQSMLLMCSMCRYCVLAFGPIFRVNFFRVPPGYWRLRISCRSLKRFVPAGARQP